MLKVETKVIETFTGHTVSFKIDNQTFRLQDMEAEEGMTSQEYAEWYKGCLDTAFEKLIASYTKKHDHT